MPISNPQCIALKIPIQQGFSAVPGPRGQAVDQTTLPEQRQVPGTELRQSVQLVANIPKGTQ
jgi:hypothetical protein